MCYNVSQLIITVRDLVQGIKEKSQLDVILFNFSKVVVRFHMLDCYPLCCDRSHTQLD